MAFATPESVMVIADRYARLHRRGGYSIAVCEVRDELKAEIMALVDGTQLPAVPSEASKQPDDGPDVGGGLLIWPEEAHTSDTSEARDV